MCTGLYARHFTRCQYLTAGPLDGGWVTRRSGRVQKNDNILKNTTFRDHPSGGRRRKNWQSSEDYIIPREKNRTWNEKPVYVLKCTFVQSALCSSTVRCVFQKRIFHIHRYIIYIICIIPLRTEQSPYTTSPTCILKSFIHILHSREGGEWVSEWSVFD